MGATIVLIARKIAIFAQILLEFVISASRLLHFQKKTHAAVFPANIWILERIQTQGTASTLRTVDQPSSIQDTITVHHASKIVMFVVMLTVNVLSVYQHSLLAVTLNALAIQTLKSNGITLQLINALK
jgi:hypothetical protein